MSWLNESSLALHPAGIDIDKINSRETQEKRKTKESKSRKRKISTFWQSQEVCMTRTHYSCKGKEKARLIHNHKVISSSVERGRNEELICSSSERTI